MLTQHPAGHPPYYVGIRTRTTVIAGIIDANEHVTFVPEATCLGSPTLNSSCCSAREAIRPVNMLENFRSATCVRTAVAFLLPEALRPRSAVSCCIHT